MNKIVWAIRSKEWIKDNPGKGTMYKTELKEDEAPPINLLAPIRNKLKGERNKDLIHDTGIYLIICEQAKSVYVGQSINMGSRMRSHKMNITAIDPPQLQTYAKIREDWNKYGAISFEFKRYLPLPNTTTSEDLTNHENNTMWEYMNNGYKLYNTVITGNIYCPENLRGLVLDLIHAINKDSSLIDKVRSIIP